MTNWNAAMPVVLRSRAWTVSITSIGSTMWKLRHRRGSQRTTKIARGADLKFKQSFSGSSTKEFRIPAHSRLRAGTDPLLLLDYGARAKLSRINNGLRRRKSKSIKGFCIDPTSGRWVKDTLNGGDDDGIDVTVPKSQRIVPIVEDHKNALLLRPIANFSEAQMATLQHALLRGIQIVAELEEGELLGEPLPKRDERKAILLYEATEGGAGVLNRLVADANRMAEIARQALNLMHFDFPDCGRGHQGTGGRLCRRLLSLPALLFQSARS